MGFWITADCPVHVPSNGVWMEGLITAANNRGLEAKDAE